MIVTHRTPHATRLCVASALLLFGVAAESRAVDCLDYRTTMHWAGGLGTPETEFVQDVEVVLPYAYVVSTSGFHVIDVSISAAPLEVAFVPHSSMDAIEIRDGYAYISGADFLVFDVSEPAGPVLVAGAGNGGHDIAIHGDFAYPVSYSSFAVIDISDPTDPTPILLEPVEGNDCESIAAHGDVLYIARSDGLAVYDVTDELDPVFVRFVDLDHLTSWVRVHDGVLYVSGEEFSSLDLTDPRNPIVLDSISLSTLGSNFDIQGTTAFVTALGVRNIDISDPANLFVISRYPNGGGRLAVAGERLFVGQATGFGVVEINDYHVALPTGALASESPVYGVSGSGSLVALATYTGGLELVDVADPASPQSLSHVATNGVAWNVHLVGSLAFVADGAAGLSIYDASEPAGPELTGWLDLDGQALDVTVLGDVAFVATGSTGLVTVDVSDPASPQLLGWIDPPGSANRVDVREGLAFVSAGSAGLHVIDVSNPSAPALAATVPGFVNDATAEPPYVYVVDPTVGLEVVDISNPTAPFETGSLFLQYANTTRPPRNVAIRDGCAYVAADRSGLQVVDVADPFGPKLLGNLVLGNPASDTARDVQILNDFVLIADEANGLKIGPLHCEDPAAVSSSPIVGSVAIRVTPNPVTSSATLRLHLTSAGLVRVDLYSVEGRRAADLFEVVLGAGVHEIEWSTARRVPTPSGMFYARLSRNGRTIGATPVLVR
ncbi:MAG: hypothetical protein R3E97_13895 [Candidatus Eisenbacteria bacterium]